MWTAANRGQYERRGQRYPSDLTDEEWSLVEPHLPPARRVDRREVLNAILYVLTTGCQWKQLPKDFPPHAAFIIRAMIRLMLRRIVRLRAAS